MIKTVSVSCATWCLALLWWQDHTMKAKSIQKIFVNKVFTHQASLGCVIENCFLYLDFDIYTQ